MLHAQIELQNGARSLSGSVEAAVDANGGRPVELLFRGRCGDQSYAFHQRIDYVAESIDLLTGAAPPSA